MSKTSLFLTAGIVLLFGANILAQENAPTTFEIGVDYSLSHFIPSFPIRVKVLTCQECEFRSEARASYI
jgi:hypothetical protein